MAALQAARSGRLMGKGTNPKGSELQTRQRTRIFIMRIAATETPLLDMNPCSSQTHRMKKTKVTLVLGSGGARGWAHLGVIRALQENDVEIESVVGCSMGSLVGAACATGRIDALHRTAVELDWRRALNLFVEFTLPRSGLVDGNKIIKTLREQISSARIEDLPIPFRAVSTDMSTGQEVVFSSGDLLEAVRASISIPGIFTPVFKGDQILVDGGLVAPVPVKTAYEMGAERVVAVNVNKDPVLPTSGTGPDETQPGEEKDNLNPVVRFLNAKINELRIEKLTPVKRWMTPRKTPNIFDVVGNSTIIIQSRIAETQLREYPPDLLIEPDVREMNFMDFHRAEHAIQKGYEKTLCLLNKGLSAK
jgi:NTE family protein